MSDSQPKCQICLRDHWSKDCPHAKSASSLAAPAGSPFVVPPFDAKWSKPDVRFFWWSWHPNYPQWSKYGVKGYATEAEGWEHRCKPINSSLDLYHNKLVREGDGNFTVVADDPCRKLDVWWKIKRQMENDQALRPARSPEQKGNDGK